MEFGKLASVNHIDFTLPADPEPNVEVLAECAAHPSTGPSPIYLGATGYNMRAWVGKWYPQGCRDKDMLRHYAGQFNTIEHNTTHYRIPDEATIARWREEVPGDFRFCPKIPQIFSHTRNLGVGSEPLLAFTERMELLGTALGCCFMQLPPHFTVHQLPALERFLSVWPPSLPIAVEVRHPSFFEATVAAETYYQLLYAHKVTAVITDVAGRRDVCHCRLSSCRTMIRFVGNALHPTDYTRIQDWGERLAEWTASGLREIYFFTHEPDNILAPDLAIYAYNTFKEYMPDRASRSPQMLPPGEVQGKLF